jgi:hypothetical protein
MKTKIKTMLAVLALSGSALIANAQDAGGPPPDGQRPPGGPGMHGHRPPPSPLVDVLDANHDGVIDADEIANAPAALKKLDKNGDGKLTPDEYRPPRPQGGPDGHWGPPPGAPDGPAPQHPPSDN